uniref:Uncharacterized protein n=1 Tax=Anguilla anguilla TaxID=7936 RepID=A0A0E9T888_ANGAN
MCIITQIHYDDSRCQTHYVPIAQTLSNTGF